MQCTSCHFLAPEGMGKPQEQLYFEGSLGSWREEPAHWGRGTGIPVCKVGLHRAPGKAGRRCARGLDPDRWAHWLFRSESVAVKLGASMFVSDSCLKHVSRHTALLYKSEKKKLYV